MGAGFMKLIGKVKDAGFDLRQLGRTGGGKTETSGMRSIGLSGGRTGTTREHNKLLQIIEEEKKRDLPGGSSLEQKIPDDIISLRKAADKPLDWHRNKYNADWIANTRHGAERQYLGLESPLGKTRHSFGSPLERTGSHPAFNRRTIQDEAYEADELNDPSMKDKFLRGEEVGAGWSKEELAQMEKSLGGKERVEELVDLLDRIRKSTYN